MAKKTVEMKADLMVVKKVEMSVKKMDGKRAQEMAEK
jgi:hypothetical protein